MTRDAAVAASSSTPAAATRAEKVTLPSSGKEAPSAKTTHERPTTHATSWGCSAGCDIGGQTYLLCGDCLKNPFLGLYGRRWGLSHHCCPAPGRPKKRAEAAVSRPGRLLSTIYQPSNDLSPPTRAQHLPQLPLQLPQRTQRTPPSSTHARPMIPLPHYAPLWPYREP